MHPKIRWLREPKALRLAREAHVNVLVAANRFNDEVERICHEEGTSHAQYVALWVLCLSEDGADGLPMTALADGLLNRAADTTRLVDRLEKAGLAERIRSPEDRRLVLVRATADGHERFTRLTARVKRFHRSQWASLSATELGQLATLLNKALWGVDEDTTTSDDATGARQ